MEPVTMLTYLVNVIKDNPTLFVVIFPTIMWWLERTERKDQTKINLDLQGKMLEALGEVKDAVAQGNLLLQILTRGRT